MFGKPHLQGMLSFWHYTTFFVVECKDGNMSWGQGRFLELILTMIYFTLNISFFLIFYEFSARKLNLNAEQLNEILRLGNAIFSRWHFPI